MITSKIQISNEENIAITRGGKDTVRTATKLLPFTSFSTHSGRKCFSFNFRYHRTTVFGPLMWQAEADSVGPNFVNPGQILLEYGIFEQGQASE